MMIFDPAGTLSMVAGVTLPVLVPFRNIVAPFGTEVTEIFPTADTAAGSSRTIRVRQIIRYALFIAMLSFQQSTEKNLQTSLNIFCQIYVSITMRR
jgi:hypothetical protein